MANILVTGGAGFIGSHVTRALLERGDTVVMLDDFNNRYDPQLKEARIQNMFEGCPKPHLIRGTIEDQETVEHIFNEQKIDAVIHLAAWASVQRSIKDPRQYTKANIDGTINILEACRKNTIRNLVCASSSSVYGNRKDIPFKETDYINNPASPYAATKAAGELLCATWHNLYHIPITCLRYFTVYGPWGRPDMAMFLFAEAMTKGKPIEMRGKTTQRDFTFVKDIVQGTLAALDTPHEFEIYNLGSTDTVPLPRLIAAIETAMGKKAHIKEVPLLPSEIARTQADISKAHKDLGYTPTTTIEEGAAQFVQWYVTWYVPHLAQKQKAAPQPVSV